jgi:hypothetical protein
MCFFSHRLRLSIFLFILLLPLFAFFSHSIIWKKKKYFYDKSSSSISSLLWFYSLSISFFCKVKMAWRELRNGDSYFLWMLW